MPDSTKTSKRLYNLDYLRGLAAIGIMFYHFSSWIYGSYESSSMMGRFGIYGVAIFYVLSGLTLYYVYYPKMKVTGPDLIDFFKKRFFRIFPLLWLTIFATIILTKDKPDLPKVLLNLTGLFGFLKWDAYIGNGVWSIGNELVFYLFFPLFIWVSKRSRTGMALFSLILLLIHLYFAFRALSPSETLSEQWSMYVNPLNQVFLFLGGFLIGMLLRDQPVKRSINLLILLAGIALFVSYPAEGDRIALVTGPARIVFTLSCFLICASFYKLDIKLPQVLNKPLTLLGEASYSVYLLHALVYIVVTGASSYIFHFSDSVRFILSVLLTVGISYIVYEKFEKYFMKLGRGNRSRQA